MLKRKIDSFLVEWKNNTCHKPLIVKGARQIGKTMSIETFGRNNYKCFVSLNFVLQEKYRNLQQQPAAATCLKSFALDGRYDVICSGSLMGLNYREIESNSVGYKQDYLMHSLDFEEFLWAMGYPETVIEDMYQHMIDAKPFSDLEMQVLLDHFHSYMITGGMPAVVDNYARQKNFSGILEQQRQLLLDYEEDITKYAVGLDQGRLKNVYNHITTFLAKENKKFRTNRHFW